MHTPLFLPLLNLAPGCYSHIVVSMQIELHRNEDIIVVVMISILHLFRTIISLDIRGSSLQSS